MHCFKNALKQQTRWNNRYAKRAKVPRVHLWMYKSCIICKKWKIKQSECSMFINRVASSHCNWILIMYISMIPIDILWAECKVPFKSEILTWHNCQINWTKMIMMIVTIRLQDTSQALGCILSDGHRGFRSFQHQTLSPRWPSRGLILFYRMPSSQAHRGQWVATQCNYICIFCKAVFIEGKQQ